MTKHEINTLTTFTWPKGFYADGIHAGLKEEKEDLGWLYSKVPAAAAGVYTTNQFQAAPTKLTKQTVNLDHQLQAVVMNSANANSCTGPQGMVNAKTMQHLAAKKLGLTDQLVGVASTGIIGEPLPMDKITNGISQLSLTKSAAVTEAVLTTDKHPKSISVQFEFNNEPVTVTGFAKGSGMIHPKMATMLGFVTTDAKIDGVALQQLLNQQVDETFNQITVDGDTSTNDMVLVLANGMAQTSPVTTDPAGYALFAAAFHQVLSFLAKSIAKDGEGATKLVEADVLHAYNHDEAQMVAKAIVGSNLVKAAIFGEDPNWGRLMVAIGQTKAHLDTNHVDVWLNDQPVVKDSQAYLIDPQVVASHLHENQVNVKVDLHNGKALGQAWGCDLTYQYVKINASYHN
ncbi:bifunctional glutamate N-acetyltransferase/amino-acid acetyltransferase ArgJ [Limosilactobacillus fermentum]|uniref:bifunctional glutamate N-acetyltransferase/amino-acid acetyltransferase ArgJ n=1 Tax=Limosilactobacillus fermentum TaxID=1613 RepID=UPI000C239CD5|nr:bifunctional glutamate N-acetyltransferase/amino-acid acetyltransferase ArgJ [Limosilactobacillus fermentum]MBM9560395.1 bifunctional glutamate N-acetyltransferase/amino-acid acetyltransferase ArgJ [Limosilactobacillus fermentum]WJD85529.1 bifunctional glutamate N-acetyltransferase/amino-acid acetyltransferase ArgJ [Limosilactobacillus fermentum]